MSAAQQVFDLPELLENIFVFLPERNIVVSKRVCRYWKQAIEGSVKIQRKLFLVADPSANEDTPVLNPMFFNDHFSVRVYQGLLKSRPVC